MELLPSGSDFIILAAGATSQPKQKLPKPWTHFAAFVSLAGLIKLEYDSDKMLYNAEQAVQGSVRTVYTGK